VLLIFLTHLTKYHIHFFHHFASITDFLKILCHNTIVDKNCMFCYCYYNENCPSQIIFGTFFWFRIDKCLGTDHLTCRGGVMVFCFVQKAVFELDALHPRNWYFLLLLWAQIIKEIYIKDWPGKESDNVSLKYQILNRHTTSSLICVRKKCNSSVFQSTSLVECTRPFKQLKNYLSIKNPTQQRTSQSW
jgi:hypothetical protein